MCAAAERLVCICLFCPLYFIYLFEYFYSALSSCEL
jgi:hypothetical protein